LNHRSICNGIGERHAQFYDICSPRLHGQHDWDSIFGTRITSGDESHKSRLILIRYQHEWFIIVHKDTYTSLLFTSKTFLRASMLAGKYGGSCGKKAKAMTRIKAGAISVN